MVSKIKYPDVELIGVFLHIKYQLYYVSKLIQLNCNVAENH